jgi:hypothetical protein
LYVGHNGGGKVNITDGAMLRTEYLFVEELGEIHGNGLVDGNVENGGLISPGSSTGALTIDGNYRQSYSPLGTFYGELLIELAAASQYDQLVVSGTATLDGTLTLSLIDGFTPSIGQTFTVLTADDVDGTFDTELLPSVPNVVFDLIYNPTSVVLTALSALPGDYNGNFVVDAADYTVWRNTLGSTTELVADGDASGTIDEGDYDVWKLHFGETVPGTGNGSAGDRSSQLSVPESASAVLMLALLGAAFTHALRQPGSRR